MKFTVTLNGVAVEKDIPTSWDQVTYRQFLKLADCGSDMAKIVSVFTGIEENLLRKAKILNLEAVTGALSFLNVPMPEMDIPETVLGYPISKNLEFEAYGQYTDLYSEFVKYQGKPEKEIIQNYPLFVAVYASKHANQSTVDAVNRKHNLVDTDKNFIKKGDYSWMLAEYMGEQFWDAPCGEVLAIGNFTLVRFIGLNLGIKPNYLKPVTPLKKLRLAIRGWRSNLAFTVRYYLWKRKLGTNARSWYFGR